MIKPFGDYILVGDARSANPCEIDVKSHITRNTQIAVVHSVGKRVVNTQPGDRVLFAYCAGDDINHGELIGILLHDGDILATICTEDSFFGSICGIEPL